MGLAYTAPVFRSQMAAVGTVWVEAQGTPEVGGNYSPANGQQPISTMSPCLGINYIMYVAPPSSDPSASLKA